MNPTNIAILAFMCLWQIASPIPLQCEQKTCLSLSPPGMANSPNYTTVFMNNYHTVSIDIFGYENIKEVKIEICGQKFSQKANEYKDGSCTHSTVSERIKITESCNGSYVICKFDSIFDGTRIGIKQEHRDQIFLLGAPDENKETSSVSSSTHDYSNEIDTPSSDEETTMNAASAILPTLALTVLLVILSCLYVCL